MIPPKKSKGARSRLKKRALSNYLFHPILKTLSAAIMAPNIGKRARPRLDNLPSDLIEEKLFNLPHKSLVCFSAVSYSWNSIIFDPEFARKHINHAARLRRYRLAVYMNPYMYDMDAAAVLSSELCAKPDQLSDGSEPSFLAFSNAEVDERDFVNKFGEKPRILAYCDELWCVEVRKSLFLWNPSMRNIVKRVPHPSQDDVVDRDFDFIYGLAYDSVNDDYKIMKIGRDPPFKTELYSLKNNCWREIEPFSSDVESFSNHRCEFVEGRFHWISRFTTAESQIVVSFDLSTDKYGEVALPHEYAEEDCNELEYDDDWEDHTHGAYDHKVGRQVVSLNGKLCAYGNYSYTSENSDHERGRFVLWVMEEYGVEKSWTKRFEIMLPYPFLGEDWCSRADKLTPFYLSDNNELLVKLHKFCCKDDKYVLMYRNGEAKPMKIVKYTDLRDYEADAFLYVESLITHETFQRIDS